MEFSCSVRPLFIHRYKQWIFKNIRTLPKTVFFPIHTRNRFTFQAVQTLRKRLDYKCCIKKIGLKMRNKPTDIIWVYKRPHCIMHDNNFSGIFSLDEMSNRTEQRIYPLFTPCNNNSRHWCFEQIFNLFSSWINLCMWAHNNYRRQWAHLQKGSYRVNIQRIASGNCNVLFRYFTLKAKALPASKHHKYSILHCFH